MNTSEASLASSAHGMSSSLTRAQSFDREASHYYEAARLLSARHSVRDGDGVAISQNLSNDWISFALQEMDRNPAVYPSSNRFDPRREPDYTDTDPGIAGQRGMLLQKFMDSRSKGLRAEVDTYLKAPDHADVVGPVNTSTAGLRQLGLPAGVEAESLAQSESDIDAAVRRRQREIRSEREAKSDAIAETGRIARNGAQDLDGNMDDGHDRTKKHFSRLPLSPLQR